MHIEAIEKTLNGSSSTVQRYNSLCAVNGKTLFLD